jgi:hypothetical protein
MIQGKKMYCDLCGKEIVRTCAANQARPLTIKTETACTNPMARHASGFQENTAHYDDLCYDCQRGAAAGIAKVLDNLKSNSEKNDAVHNVPLLFSLAAKENGWANSWAKLFSGEDILN